jgi:hypothetical protein
MLTGLGDNEIPAPRLNLRLPVVLRAGASETFLSAESVNVSETGMLIHADDQWPPGSELSFEFSPDLQGRAEVIWTREADSKGTLLGMKFRSLQEGARKALVQLMLLPEDDSLPA